MMAGVPEIYPLELKRRLDAGDPVTIVDVREEWELEYARLPRPEVVLIPMSAMARERENVFPPELRSPDAEIVVMCHHGVRSANVTAWMMQLGWKNVSSLAGGIDAYAVEVDSSVGMY